MSGDSRPDPGSGAATELATELIGVLAGQDGTLAIAESLTGGRLTAVLTSVPGSSAVVRGAVVAYASSVKEQLLGVDPALLAGHGPVSADVAAQMARGVQDLLATVYAVATTGEAGPDSASGAPVGTVFVAVSGPRGTVTEAIWDAATGDVQAGSRRAAIQRATVLAALQLLRERCVAPEPVGRIDDSA